MIGAVLASIAFCGTIWPVTADKTDPKRLATFSQLMERSVVPQPIAKVFSLNDRHHAKVCVLNNVFADHQDTPQQCNCSFARLSKWQIDNARHYPEGTIELQCANDPNNSPHNCNNNVCETCCIVSLSAAFTKELHNSGNPVICKTRCINSAVVSDVTQDSQQLLAEFLRKVNALYHPDVIAAKTQGGDVIPTQYHVVHLQDQREDTF